MKLEEFIKRNREKFDDDFDDAIVWKEIEKTLASRSRRGRLFYLITSIAAVFSLLVICFYIVYQKGHENGQNFAREKLEVESYYEEKINLKLAKMASMPISISDLEELDHMDMNLNPQPINSIEKEAQLKAIIENFETRLMILEKIISRSPNTEINDDNKLEKQSI